MTFDTENLMDEAREVARDHARETRDALANQSDDDEPVAPVRVPVPTISLAEALRQSLRRS